MTSHEILKPSDATIHSPTTGPTLRPWDVGPVVTELQELLRAHGFRIGVTGEFDSYTEDAVMIFQRRHDLRIDAIVGPRTWAALKNTVKPGTRVLRRGLSGADVHELQGLLQVNGYAIARDGMFGNQTKEAVQQFQLRHKLNNDGRVDRVTWNLLTGQGVGLKTH